MKNKYRGYYVLPLSFALFWALSTPLTSQNGSPPLSGIVSDAKGPLGGVNIIVKNSARGTQSDLDGHYEIAAQRSDTVVFSYLGYKTQEIAVGRGSILNITMQPDATALDAVVINAGYYKVSDKEKTGSISRITAKEIENQPVQNPLAAMQGRMPGIHITQNSGVPGSGFEVRIRGKNSIAAGNNPLYVVDGVPYTINTLGATTVASSIIALSDINPLNSLDPNNIESIEVLKDADATAIYGSRGANGVVLITTKSGKNGDTKLTVRALSGLASITRKLDLLNTEQYLAMRREAFANDGYTEYPVTAYDLNGTWQTNRYTDWQEELIGGTAYTNNVQATLTGGNAQTSFLLSGGYYKETTVFPGDFKYGKGTVHAKMDHSSPNEKLKVSFSANYAADKNELPGADLSLQAKNLPPNAPALYDSEGNLNWENGTWENPLAILNGEYTNSTNSLIANTVLSYKLFERLQLQTSLGYTDNRLEEDRTSPNTIYNPDWGLDSGFSSIYLNSAHRSSWIVEPQINWEQPLGQGLLKILAGATFQQQTADILTKFGSGFPSNNLIHNLGAASYILAFADRHTDYRYEAIYGRVNYNWKEKYILNLTGRHDGSSRFGPDNRFANFAAVGVAWLYSDEPFVKNNLPFLSFGKLRGSYGSSGNDQIGDYGYLDTYSTTGVPYNGNIGISPTQLYNPNYGWEINEKFEIGLETAFFKNRLQLNANYYDNRSSNQLTGIPLPGTTGFGNIQANLNATVQNYGWEFSLVSNNLNSEVFKWTTSFNISLPKNKLLEFPNLEQSTYRNSYVIGEPITIRKVYHVLGVNPETGIFEFEDYNNDGVISAPDDKQMVVDMAPKYYGGLENVLSYKNLRLDIFFQFNKQKASNNFFYGNTPGTMANQTTEVLDRWQQPGDEATMQMFTSGDNPEAVLAFSHYGESDGSISDAPFVRLKNVALTYTLPESVLKGMDCRVYMQGQNVFTITKFNGGDPERVSGFLPPLRQVAMGVELSL
ncbi:SusC/RagA family TonB-linked outer membrane protein [Aequorivita antarctica]|uniref:SusC/RagA family TonB-linked outer membrane protein n=1 Tax=Aequorivita antarctica TaxID=153266 RepID=A0A5C6YYN9_9FLAO|nr:SusC/RagA family TonB-linked outer membrane protein [Aequorivita antarctica]TXD72729.1 SusC/RagA family TonB-linked outer membrane protein [Aequorivita antarctica]SRX74747.1 TonB-dependent receptor SusC [Aequorivita antarctica]